MQCEGVYQQACGLDGSWELCWQNTEFDSHLRMKILVLNIVRTKQRIRKIFERLTFQFLIIVFFFPF